MMMYPYLRHSKEDDTKDDCSANSAGGGSARKRVNWGLACTILCFIYTPFSVPALSPGVGKSRIVVESEMPFGH